MTFASRHVSPFSSIVPPSVSGSLSLLRFPCEFRSRAVLAKFLSGILSVYRTFVQQDDATAVSAVAHVAIFRQLD